MDQLTSKEIGKRNRDERNEKIKKQYEELNEVKEFGVQKYRQQWIFAKIGNKWCLAPKTIEDIVFERNKRKE